MRRQAALSLRVRPHGDSHGRRSRDRSKRVCRVARVAIQVQRAADRAGARAAVPGWCRTAALIGQSRQPTPSGDGREVQVAGVGPRDKVKNVPGEMTMALSRRRFLRSLSMTGAAIRVGLPPLAAMLNMNGTAYAAPAKAGPIQPRFLFWF